jgi:hypothetical protein
MMVSPGFRRPSWAAAVSSTWSVRDCPPFGRTVTVFAPTSVETTTAFK